MALSRFGITLIELLVVAVCICILLGLLIPAVGTGHVQTRRWECSVRLTNLALAAMQHEQALGTFPGYVNDFGNYLPGEHPVDPNDPDADTTSLVAHRKIGPWAVSLLPWLDAQPTYEQWTVENYPIAFGGSDDFPLSDGASGRGFNAFAAPNLSVFQCPEDPAPRGNHGRNSYICNAGLDHRRNATQKTSWTLARADGSRVLVDFARSMSVANGVFNNKFPGLLAEGATVPVGTNVTREDFQDGQTYTALFSESLYAIPWHRAGLINASDLVTPDGQHEILYEPTARYTQSMVWHYEDDSGIDGASLVKPIHRINGSPLGDRFLLVMHATNAADLARPSSAHHDGVHMSCADGHTRYVSDTIDYHVYQALLTPNGSQSEMPRRDFMITDELGK